MNDWIEELGGGELPPSAKKLNDKGDWAIRRNITRLNNNQWSCEFKIVKTETKDAFLAGIAGAEVPVLTAEENLDASNTIVMEALADIYTEILQIKSKLGE